MTNAHAYPLLIGLSRSCLLPQPNPGHRCTLRGKPCMSVVIKRHWTQVFWYHNTMIHGHCGLMKSDHKIDNYILSLLMEVVCSWTQNLKKIHKKRRHWLIGHRGHWCACAHKHVHTYTYVHAHIHMRILVIFKKVQSLTQTFFPKWFYSKHVFSFTVVIIICLGIIL